MSEHFKMINVQSKLFHLRTLSPLDPVHGVYSRERNLKTLWSWYYFLSVESFLGKTQNRPPSPREPAASVSGTPTLGEPPASVSGTELPKPPKHPNGE